MDDDDEGLSPELSRSLNRLQVYYECANLLETFFTARIDTLPLPV